MATFTSRIAISPGCWPWTGYCNGDGYGIFNPQRGVKYRAHRFAYELFVGMIPEGLTVDHLCKNRRCCNPLHMELVTRGENALRGEGPCAMNARKTHCMHGHEFTPQNTRIKPEGRECRACDRERHRRDYANLSNP